MSPRSNAPGSSPEKGGAPALGARTERPPAAPPTPPEPESVATATNPSDLSGRFRALLRCADAPRTRERRNRRQSVLDILIKYREYGKLNNNRIKS